MPYITRYMTTVSYILHDYNCYQCGMWCNIQVQLNTIHSRLYQMSDKHTYIAI